MISKLKYACIGAGGIADKKHLPGYSKRNDIEIIAVCDSNINLSQNMADKYNIPSIYADFNEMFDKHDLDLVSICVPNYLHAPITIAALKKGINVHCEKPLALNAEEAQNIVNIKDEYKKKVMVGLNQRFSNEAQFVKRYAQEGLFGQVYHAKCGWKRRSGIPGKGVWFTNKKLSGGGALIDLGVHFLDLVLFFMGYPKVSSVFGATYSEFGRSDSRLRTGYKNNGAGVYDVEDMAVGMIRLKGGATIDFDFSWASNIEKETKYFELIGTKGGVSYIDGELKIYTEVFDTNINIIPEFGKAEAKKNEFELYIDCIKNNKEPSSSPEQAVELMKIIDCIYLSSKLEREVNFDKEIIKNYKLKKILEVIMSNKQKEEKVRIGIIGCGGIATGKHLPSLSKLKNVEMVGFCDIIEERAKEAAKKYGIEGAKIYTNYSELLKDKSIDVVHILTPNKSHSIITVDALEAGKHVMCEKPMAKTAAEAEKMVEASKRTGKKLTIGYQNRHRADSDYLKKICLNGDLGEIYYAKAHAIRRRAVPTWGVFLNEDEQGGGPLIDIGTHALDLTLWLMDNYKVKSVMGNIYHKLGSKKDAANAWGSWDPDKFTVEDSAFGFITMENGATITLEASWALNSLEVGEAQTTLCGTEGGADMKDGLRINGEKFSKLYVTKPELNAGGVAFYDGKSESDADREARLWIDCIINDTEPVVKPEQAIVVTQILEAIYMSAKSGKPVFF